MKLTENIAQSIVNRTMKLIQHNINIMNEEGIIIGSGDPSRLYTYHQGADRVLREGKPVSIKKGNPELLKGSKEGINLPIFLDRQAVGVVGITGDPEEIHVYGAMVQAMAELMLEEAVYWQQIRMEEQARFSLVNDLIRQDPDKNYELLRSMANYLGYDLYLPRVVIVIEAQDRAPLSHDPPEQEGLRAKRFQDGVKDRLIRCFLPAPQDLYVSGTGGRLILLKSIKSGQEKEIKSVLEKGAASFLDDNLVISMGIGKVCLAPQQIPDAFAQALDALHIGCRLFGCGKVYQAEDLEIETLINKVEKNFRIGFYREVLGELQKSGNSKDLILLETAKMLLNTDLKFTEAAKKLYIHRNTLNYRVAKIQQKTGLNLYSINDAIKFKLALLCWQIEQEADKTS